jgi:hypothetical protein
MSPLGSTAHSSTTGSGFTSIDTFTLPSSVR